MSRANIQNFYPDNPVINNVAVNDQYTQIQTATTTINESNVRFEGVDMRQIAANPVLVYGKQFSNSYLLQGPGTSPSAGSLYISRNNPAWAYGAVSEAPINHDSTGTKTTVIGNGTKFNLNVGIGVPVQVGDIIRIDLDVNAWDIQELISGVTDSPFGTLANVERKKLCNGVAAQGNTFAGNFGSGMGEWCYFIYPKVNITAATGLDADYQTLGNAFGISGIADFGAATPTSVGVNPPAAGSSFDLQNDFDHALVLPIHQINAGTQIQRPSFMPYYEGHLNTLYAGTTTYDSPPQREMTSIVFVANANVTLYSIQLYISGIWRMASNGNAPVVYLEGQDCDPGLGGQHFGLSTGVYLEECRWGIQIFRKV